MSLPAPHGLRFPVLLLGALALVACKGTSPAEPPAPTATVSAQSRAPEPEPAAPSASAATASKLKGGWSLAVTSSSPSADPSAFDTKEKRAKALFDHHAEVKGEQVVVTQRTLAQAHKLKDDASQKLEQAVLALDWKALADKAKAEPPTEGGTVFSVEVTVGDQQHTLKTADIDAHPELLALVMQLREAAGMP